jgi:multidrug resistance efflux pump
MPDAVADRKRALLGAGKASAEAVLAESQVNPDKTTIPRWADGRVAQFALRETSSIRGCYWPNVLEGGP